MHWREGQGCTGWKTGGCTDGRVRDARAECTDCKSGECTDVRIRDALAGRQEDALTGWSGAHWPEVRGEGEYLK